MNGKHRAVSARTVIASTSIGLQEMAIRWQHHWEEKLQVRHEPNKKGSKDICLIEIVLPHKNKLQPTNKKAKYISLKEKIL